MHEPVCGRETMLPFHCRTPSFRPASLLRVMRSKDDINRANAFEHE